MRRGLVTWVAGLATGLATAGVIWLAVQPSCPTEDSCSREYVGKQESSWWRGPHWVTKELIP